MRQLIVGAGDINTGGVWYSGLVPAAGSASGLFTTDVNRVCTPWSVAGTFRKLRVKVASAPGAGDTYTFTLYVNSLSALTVTISDTNTEAVDLSNEVTVAAGDHVYLHRNSSGFDASNLTHWSLEFEGDTDNESGYQCWAIGAIFGGNTYHAAPFGMHAAVTTVNISLSLVAVPGVITRYDVRYSIAAGVGESNFSVLYKNGVAQDGTGGTPDTRLTVGNTTTGNLTGFSLTIAPGDLIQYRFTQSGGAASTFIGVSTKVVATTDGYFQLSALSLSSLIPTGATNYGEWSFIPWTTTEANATQTLDSSWWASTLYVSAASGTGAGKSYTFDVRQNSASPANTPTAILSGTTSPTTASDADAGHLIVFASTDTIGLRSVPAGTPSAPQIHFALGVRDRAEEAESLCGAESVYVWMELQTDDGVKVYAKENLALDDTFKEGRVLSFGSVTRAFARDRGGYETATASIELNDTDRVMRGLADTGTLLNKRCDIYASSAAGLRSGATPRRIMQALVRRYKPLPDLKFRLDLEDFFGSSFSNFTGDRTIPQRLFTVADFPNINNPADDPTSPGNPTLVGKPVPIAYGLLSDSDLYADSVGVVPCHFVGRRTVNAFEWDEYVVCGHAVKSIDDWFASASEDANDLPRELMPDATEGVDFLIPGYAGWLTHVGNSDMYRDFNGNRYTVIYARGPRSDAAREGKVPLTLNVQAIEDVGDGTGDLIESLPEQIEHLICNWILQSYTSGAWPAIPTIGTPALERFLTTSTDTVKLTSELRITGGYLGAFMIGWDGSFLSIRDAIAAACRSCDIDIGINRDGQLFMSMIDSTASSLKAWNDVVDVLRGSFDMERDFDRLANRIDYRYQRQYIQPVTELVDVVASGGSPVAQVRMPETTQQPSVEWLVDHQTQEDATSITNNGETRIYDLDLPFVRDTETADDVVLHTLERLKNGPVHATFDVDLCGTDIENGDNETLTHYQGMTATGWTDRLLRNEEHTVNLDTLSVTLVARDLEFGGSP